MIARVESVEEEPGGTALVGDVSVGATVLALEDVADFAEREYGAERLVIAEESYDVVTVDDDAETVTIPTPGLVVAALAGDPVVPVDALGEQVTRWTIWLNDGADGSQPAIPIHSLVPLVSSTADSLAGVGAIYHREGDDLYVTSLLDKEPDHDGEKLVTATVSSDALTTASSPDILNGTFEDAGSAGAPFAGWEPSYWFNNILESHIDVSDAGDQIAGSRSLAIRTDTDTAGLRIATNRVYPVTGGQPVDVTCLMAASRTVDRSALSDPVVAELIIHTSTPDRDPMELFVTDGNVIWQNFPVSTLTTVPLPVQALGVDIPAGHTRMQVSIGALPSGDGSGYRLIADEVHMKKLSDPNAAQRVETLSVGAQSVDSLDTLIVGGVSMRDILSQYTRSSTAPTVTEFAATAVRSYDAAGDDILNAGVPADGYGRLGYDATDGNRACVIDFDSTAIAAALAGKTISKVEAYLFLNHRGGSGTGTIPIGFHSSATPQTTYAAVTGKAPNLFRPSAWQQGTGRWVDVTSTVANWQTGTWKGILLGPGQTAVGVASSSLIYSNHVRGMGTTTPPKLRFTYT